MSAKIALCTPKPAPNIKDRFLEDCNVPRTGRPVVERGTNRGLPVPDGSRNESPPIGLKGADGCSVETIALLRVQGGRGVAKTDDVERYRCHELETGLFLHPQPEGRRVSDALLDDGL